MTIINAANIHKTYATEPPTHVLKGITFSAKKGQSIAIVGKSGSGKSTLLHILGSLESPSQGSVEICGKKCGAKTSFLLRQKHIGFIFQSYNLLEEESVLQNLLLPFSIARIKTPPHSEEYLRAIDFLKKANLLDKMHVQSKLLSGGEKQRVAILRALIKKPDIIFADEPTGNLDADHSHDVAKLLIKSVKEDRTALILVTHDIDFAKECDQIWTLQNGILLPFEK